MRPRRPADAEVNARRDGGNLRTAIPADRLLALFKLVFLILTINLDLLDSRKQLDSGVKVSAAICYCFESSHAVVEYFGSVGGAPEALHYVQQDVDVLIPTYDQASAKPFELLLGPGEDERIGARLWG